MSENLGDLIVSISTDLSKLDQGLKNANSKVNEAANKIADKTKDFGLKVTAIGAAITGTFALMIHTTTEYADEIIKTSARTGIATETLSRLKFVADQTESSFTDLVNGLKILSKNAEESRTGNVKLQLTFGELGIKVDDVNGKLKSADALFLEVADAFQKIDDNTLKTSLAMQLFGRSGAALVPVLNLGANGIRDLEKEADRLGLTLTKNNAGAIKDYVDGNKALKGAINGLFIELSVNIIPTLTKFVRGITDVVAGITNWAKQHPILTNGITSTGAALGAILLVLGPLTVAVGALQANFVKLGISMTAVQTGLLKFTAVGAAAFAGWKIGEMIDQTHVLDNALSGPDGLFTKAIEGWRGMIDKAKTYFGIVDKVQNTPAPKTPVPASQSTTNPNEQPVQDLGVLVIGPPRNQGVAAGPSPSPDASNTRKQAIVDEEAELEKLKAFYDAFDQGLIAADQNTTTTTLVSFRAAIQEKAQLIQTYNDLWLRAHASMAAAANAFVQTLNTRLSTAITNIVTGAQTAGQAFKELGSAIVNMIVEYVVQQGVAFALSKVISLFIHTTQTALAASISAAWAPAAAFVSLATFGANAAPAAAAISGVTGLAAALAVPHGFAEGTDSVPAMLSPGELIIPPTFADAIRSGNLSLSGKGRDNTQDQASPQITINVQAEIKNDLDVKKLAQQLAFETNRELRYVR